MQAEFLPTFQDGEMCEKLLLKSAQLRKAQVILMQLGTGKLDRK
jgi:hypothetical protein